MISKPICVKCEIEMSMIRSGVNVAEMFRGNEIYKVWKADLWECPICKVQVTSGYGSMPLAHHFQDDISKYKNDIDIRAFEKVKDAKQFGGK